MMGPMGMEKKNINDVVDAIQLQYLWARQAKILQANERDTTPVYNWMTGRVESNKREESSANRID